MKIGLHTITYSALFYDGPGLTLEEQIVKAADYGYEAVEVMAKRPVASPFDMDADRCARCRDLAGEKGLSMDFVAGYIDLGRPAATDRERELVWAKESFRMTRDLGARYIRVYAGGETIHSGAPIRSQWDWCVENIRLLSPIAQDMGIQIALEIHTGVAQTVDALCDMLRQIGDPNVVVVLDPPLLAFRGEDAAESFNQVNSVAKIVHAHIGDFVRQSPLVRYSAVPGLAVEYIERLAPVPLGQGIVELDKFMRAAAAAQFDGVLSFEICTPFHVHHNVPTIEHIEEGVRDGVTWLKATRAKIGGS